ncbi:hypothetical protein [Blastococcus sp. SYSU DS0619]
MTADQDHRSIISTFVLGGLEPLRLVIHYDDGTWAFLCNTTAEPEHLVTVHTGEVFTRYAEALTGLRRLPSGHLAERQEPGDPWTTEAYVEE